MRRQLRVLLMALLMIGLAAGGALANSAPPLLRGDTTGVLLPGSSNQMHVKREQLRFDLVKELDQAKVTARYEMENRGGALSGFPVVFVVQQGYGIQEPLKAIWDGKPLNVAPVATEQLNAEQLRQMATAWTAMDVIIDPVTGDQYSNKDFFGPKNLQLFQFKLDVPAGASGALEVKYTHHAAEDRNRHAHWIYHYQYLLLPAKGWASFGPLEITVKPAGGDLYFASTLPLQLEGGEYRATFPGLPDQNLAFGVMSKQGLVGNMADPAPYYGFSFVVLIALAVLVGIGAGWLSARVRRRGWAIATGVAAGAVVGGFADMLLAFGVLALLPALRDQGYSNAFVGIGQFMVALPVTMVVAGVTAAIRHRRRWAAAAARDAAVKGE